MRPLRANIGHARFASFLGGMSVTLEFKGIRPYRGAKHEAFEELVCQLIRRTDAAGNDSWVRLDGAGGDGGVEAYWFPSPTEQVGVQAKFFTKSAEIDWKQVIASFETAVKIHPKLTEYRIHLACDLTGPTARGGRTGAQAWVSARAAMESRAANAGRKIRVTLKTASELISDLARPEAVGLRELWFGAVEINPGTLQSLLDSAVGALGERYHPEDHVDVGAQDVLRALSREPIIRKKLDELVDLALDCDRLRVPKDWVTEAAKALTIGQVNAAIDEMGRIKEEAYADPSRPWPVTEWKVMLEALVAGLNQISHDTYGVTGDDETKYSFQWFRHGVRKIMSRVDDLLEFVSSKALAAEASRAAILIGPAGCGKSHLLAAGAAEILAGGGQCMLLLGHRFHAGHLWSQIAAILGFPGKGRDEILGALDACAAAARRRALLIVDALNEGPMRASWHMELDGFAAEVLSFPNLALAISCRDVFVPHVVSSTVQARFPVVQLRGFETAGEQEAAARVYLDGRGIARPSVPWLAPEFVNPLFLRSCATSLKSAGIKSFPTGLHGTKQLLAFYIDALARTLGTNWDGATTLAAPCKAALVDLAKSMAVAGQDWLERTAADAVVNAAFSSFAAPHGMTWMEVLLRNGVLREDPHPETELKSDPLQSKPDVIRYAFQRFQDHLMADALLAGARDAKALFEPGRPLAFAVYPDGRLRWEWNGLGEALSIQLPEKLATELVDALPGGPSRHWGEYAIEAAFSQSVKWRDPQAITERTLELANRLRGDTHNILTLMIELAARPDHPWNADMLDRNLQKWKLPERDRIWTVHISVEGMYEGHPVNRLIVWSETAPKDHADDEVLRLCAVALSWLLTSSTAWIRDRATKALASLFVDRVDLFPKILPQFATVDDLYVVERVLAAAYGVLVRGPGTARATAYATAVWECFFGKDYIPPNLLLLDYAWGILEVSDRVATLPAHIELAKARPPYPLKLPRLNVTKEAVEKIAKKAGGEQILRSCGEWGDFQRYEISGRIDDITKVRLTSPAPPLSGRQKAHRFEREVIQPSRQRRAALRALEKVWVDGQRTRVFSLEEGLGLAVETEDATSNPAWKDYFDKAEKALCKLLTTAEVERYRTEWLPSHHPDRTIRTRLDAKIKTWPALPASYWIAKKAYGFGWTAKRFGEDIGDQQGHERPKVERIGKKYQWLAASELLARLVNNYWMIREYDDGGPFRYSMATDVDFERDVEPTLFKSARHAGIEDAGRERDLLLTPPSIPPRDGAARLQWPFSGNVAGDAHKLIAATDAGGQSWLRLSWHISNERRTELHRKSSGHNMAQREFVFIRAVLCAAGEGKGIVESLKAVPGHVDLMDWKPPEYTDGPYVYEANRRGTWPPIRWWVVGRWGNDSHRVSWPVEEWLWESHLDKSLPDGARFIVPAPWLMEAGKLGLEPLSPNLIMGADGTLVGWSTREAGHQSGLLMRADWIEKFLTEQNFDCVWIVVGEREAWADGDQAGARAYRRFNSLTLLSGGKRKVVSWNEDQGERNTREATRRHRKAG